MSALEYRVYCYRFYHSDPWDVEQIWSTVDRCGGWMSLHIDHIDFYLPQPHHCLFILAYPLQPRPELNYV